MSLVSALPENDLRLEAASYQAVRRQSEALCQPLSTEDYVVQSMAEVSPTKWHLAHTTWRGDRRDTSSGDAASARAGGDPAHGLVAAWSAPWWRRSVCEEARRLLKGLRHSRAYVRYSRPQPGDKPGMHFDATGRLDLAVLEQLGVSREADFYLCGPQALQRDFVAGLAHWGVPADHVHVETFGPGESDTVGIVHAQKRRPHLPPGAIGTGPRVSFARSGLDVPWDPARQSLLELAEACDVPVRWACRSGVCHTCETALLTGGVDYDPAPLEAPAKGNLLICCSRPRGDVILDL